MQTAQINRGLHIKSSCALHREREYPKVCVNLQTDVRKNHSVWRLFLWQEELGYSKYDYRNKETDNSRNGHSSKTMHTSYGDMDVAIPSDRNGDYEPQLIKKYQNTVTQDMEEKILSMYE